MFFVLCLLFTDGFRSVQSPAGQSPPDAGVSAEEWAARENELLAMEARLEAVVDENVSSWGYVLNFKLFFARNGSDT